MGNFYTNATLKGPDQRSIARAIDRMRRVAAVAPSQGDLTVVFDRESERQDGSAYRFVERLTRELDCLALYVTNHDDSVLYYRLYKSGENIDHYDSCPNYFEGDPIPPEGGNAKALCDALGVPAARETVHEILHYDRYAAANEGARRYAWEVERHGDLATALGLPLWAVGCGYTYLASGDWPEGLSQENIISLPGEGGGRIK
jgi:hypothetical protein